jgi:hypothetical protein
MSIKKILLNILIGIIGLGFLFLIYQDHSRKQFFEEHGRETEAEIINFEVDSSDSEYTYYEFTYGYTVEEKYYEKKTRGKSSFLRAQGLDRLNYKAGEKIKIMYQINDPEDCIFASKAGKKGLLDEILLFLLGLVILICGFVKVNAKGG